MERMELKRQIEAAYERLVEAEILMNSIARGTDTAEAAAMAQKVAAVQAAMFAYRGSLYQHSVIPGWREPVDTV
jgi:hypothetical protein